jgi:hypothetical protein
VSLALQVAQHQRPGLLSGALAHLAGDPLGDPAEQRLLPTHGGLRPGGELTADGLRALGDDDDPVRLPAALVGADLAQTCSRSKGTSGRRITSAEPVSPVCRAIQPT